MWICNRCQSTNENADGRCLTCGAARQPRRFSAGAPIIKPVEHRVLPPRAASAAPRLPAQEADNRPDAAQQTPQRTPAGALREGGRRIVRCAAGRWLVGLGGVVAVALPLLTVFFAIRLQTQLWPPIQQTLFGPGAASPGLLNQAVYYVLAALAASAAALPGLSALGLGRLLIRLTPPQPR